MILSSLVSYAEPTSLKCLTSVHFTLSFAAPTSSTYSIPSFSFYLKFTASKLAPLLLLYYSSTHFLYYSSSSFHPPFFYQIVIVYVPRSLCFSFKYYFHDASSFHPFIFNLTDLYLTFVSYKWHTDKSSKIHFFKRIYLVCNFDTFSFLLFSYIFYLYSCFPSFFEFLKYAYTHFFSISFLVLYPCSLFLSNYPKDFSATLNLIAHVKLVLFPLPE